MQPDKPESSLRFKERFGLKRFYVPTDGTHTQATGAACYARLAVEGLKAQGIPHGVSVIQTICTSEPVIGK